MPRREFDIIIWGATGFTGKLVVEHLYKNYGVNKSLTWAIGGRSQAKLEAVRAEFSDDNLPLILGDSFDESSLDAMTKRTKVILSTVGPYSKYGKKLVAACVKQQTHYCDLTGEELFVKYLIDHHHEAAKANGTKIVPCCGFDSIPSDLGVFYMQQEVKKRTGQFSSHIKMRVKETTGTASGGSIATLKYMMELIKKDRSLLAVFIEPYSLNPIGEMDGPDQTGIRDIVYDETIKSWLYPFIMEGINTRIVRRGHALAGYPYGRDFQYEEASMSGDGAAGKEEAIQEVAKLRAFRSTKSPADKTAQRNKMPKPGEGPSRAAMEAGNYILKFYTLNTNQEIIGIGTVTGDMDPGYGSTSKIISEAAVCLAKDELPTGGGVLTPSIAMGGALLKRLVANAGLTFSYEEAEGIPKSGDVSKQGQNIPSSWEAFADTLKVAISADKVLRLTKVNAKMGYGISKKMLSAFQTIFTDLQKGTSIRAVVIDAEGTAMQNGAVMVTEIKPSLKDLTHEDFAEIVEIGQRLGSKIANLPIPVIGIARGGAIGGGLELLLRSDFLFCTHQAQFSFPEVTMGFVAVWGGTQLGGRYMSFRKAQELLLMGLPIDGKQAAEYGLVTRSFVDNAALDKHLDGLLAHFRHCSPASFEWTKKCLAAIWDKQGIDEHQQDIKAQVETMTSGDFLKAVSAYRHGLYYDFIKDAKGKKR